MSRGASVARIAFELAAALTLHGNALAAPKKPEPAPAVQPAPEPTKKGMFSKAKRVFPNLEYFNVGYQQYLRPA